MNDSGYLRIRSEYSLLQSSAKIEDLVQTARDRGIFALALTDVGNLHGIVAFFKACQKYQIHPIAGVELHLAEEGGNIHDPKTPAASLILLAETNEGYTNLVKLVTYANLHGECGAQRRISFDQLADCQAGLLALTAWEDGSVGRELLAGNREQALKRLVRLRDLMGRQNVYVEIQERGRLQDRAFNQQLIELAASSDVSVVAAQTVSCLEPQDEDVLLLLEGIRQGQTLNELESLKWKYRGQSLLPWPDFAEKFRYVPQAVSTIYQIIKRCQVTIPIGETHLPSYPIPEMYSSADDYLRELTLQGVYSRYGKQVKDTDRFPVIMNRVEQELQIISRMGFSSYFLIVWDFMAFAHSRRITTGPGRGSAAGSLVAYLLRITDVDPLKYGLLMERFLNPERISMPDIDIDFEYERRLEVIAYVTEKYGRDRVAQIATFGTLAAKAAIRDVGRVLGKSQPEIDALAKAIPNSLGITLDQALQSEEGLAARVHADPAIGQWFRLAQKIEGLPRHTSIHAAGVVISAEPLTQYTALQPGPEGGTVTQLAMEDVEAIGLLKMDFLGLRTLTLIDRAMTSIKARCGKEVEWDSDMQDRTTYQLLARGQTDGCFQLESTGVKLVLRDLKPSRFEDIIAVISLYRPGPMENIPSFIKAKHGEIPVAYPHPSLEPILRDTYGVIVYQEQIMQIASFMAGFSLGQADLLRRAVGKKKREILDEQRALFVAGCLAKGYPQPTADEVYDLIVRFADYGFNRSHAAAYGVLSYRTAFLKAHYPAEFFSALLSLWIGNPVKLSRYVEDAKRFGIAVTAPDINKSVSDFCPGEDAAGLPKPTVRFGLSAVRYVGVVAVSSILQERKQRGPFQDLLDFCKRMDLRVVNRRMIESLIYAGAFDFTGHTRNSLLTGLADALAIGSEHSLVDSSQMSLFGLTEELSAKTVQWPDLPEFPPAELLAKEKETVGVFLSGHPLDSYRELFVRSNCYPIGEIDEIKEDKVFAFGGRINRLKPVQTKKGQIMAFLELEDFTGVVEAIVFPAIWGRVKSWMELDCVVLVQGRIQGMGEDARLIVETAQLAESAARVAVFLKIDNHNRSPELLKKLREVLLSHPGEDSIRLVYMPDREQRELSQKINWTESLRSEIAAILGEHAIYVRSEE